MPSSKAPHNRPTLLSGGNPQIPKGDGDPPVQAFIAAIPDWKQDVARRLDRLIEQTVPTVRKAVRWNSPFYGGPQPGWFLSYHCFARYLKVAFLNGAELDPLPPVASKSARVRYLHIHEHDDLADVPLAQWIRQAAELPGEEMFK